MLTQKGEFTDPVFLKDYRYLRSRVVLKQSSPKKENSSSKIEDCPPEAMNFAPIFVRSVGYTSL
jgi:hypothetical protein